MTYIPVDVFIECMQTSGIKSKYEYYELHNRGIVPTDLMPKSPALEYNNTYQKARRASPEGIAYRKAYQKTPEAKAYHKAYRITPEVIARRKAWRKTPEQNAKQKAWRASPESKAYHKAYYQRTKT
tara:strand:+ start:136 stop:513 length:378 start_codon:yes stop_codon:yes gene_type:complete